MIFNCPYKDVLFFRIKKILNLFSNLFSEKQIREIYETEYFQIMIIIHYYRRSKKKETKQNETTFSKIIQELRYVSHAKRAHLRVM